MKRTAAAAVVGASAVAGVVLGVVVASASPSGNHARTGDRTAVVSSGSGTSGSSSVSSGEPSTSPTPAPTTASTATTTKATSPVTSPSPTTPGPTVPTIPAAAANVLMQVSDFGQAGWTTTSLVRTVTTEAGASERIACLQGKLGDLAGATWAVTATFQGRSISAVETVADYGTAAQADAAAQAVRGWVQGCTAYLSTSSFRVTVGGEVPTPEGSWRPLSGSIAGGVALTQTGSTVAVLEIRDPQLKPETMATLLSGASQRLG